MGATGVEASRLVTLVALLGIWIPVSGAAAEGQEKPSSARPEWSGPSLGFRTGYGKPFGDALGSTSQSSLIEGMIPVWVDLGYQLSSHFYVGGYFQFAIGMTPGDCAGCSANVMRFGFNVHYHLFPTNDYDPWVGIGTGYEVLNLSGLGTSSTSLGGFEFGNLQVGLDFPVTDNVTLGPFVAISIAEYMNGSGLSGTGLSFEMGKKPHEWLILGVRGVFNFRKK